MGSNNATLSGKKVDRVLHREIQYVKAIATYNSKFKVISSIEMDKQEKFHRVVKKEGTGKPRLYVDKKLNKKRGIEIDLVLVGRRNIEDMGEDVDRSDWLSFGHIILTEKQARELAYKILEVCNSDVVGAKKKHL